MRVASIGGFCHQNADESGGNRLIAKFKMHIPTRAVVDRARWESLPHAIGTHVPVQRVVIADPILHHVSDGIGVDPLDVDSIDGPGHAHIDHDPLRVQYVAFARKMAGQVRIALPIALNTGHQRSIAAGHEIAMRQRIGIAVVDRFAQVSATCVISALAGRIAPCTVFVPVPCGQAQLAIVAHGDGTPTQVLDPLNRFGFAEIVHLCF